MALRKKHIDALQRAIDEAEVWRGTLTGNPDPTALEEYDAFIATARAGLKEVRAVYRTLPRRTHLGRLNPEVKE